MRLQKIVKGVDRVLGLLAWPLFLFYGLVAGVLYAEYRKTDPAPEYESLLDLVDHEDQHSGA
jgi:hypothetical protein